MAIYYDCWTNYEALRSDYTEAPDEADIVYAGYTYESYVGDALVVFVRDGEWWENNDGHCSCYGLNCWEPERTMPQALLMREGWPGLHDAVKERILVLTRDVVGH